MSEQVEIERYHIVRTTSSPELEVEVKNFVDAGWIPTGGIATLGSPEDPIFYQAMVKPKKQGGTLYQES